MASAFQSNAFQSNAFPSNSAVQITGTGLAVVASPSLYSVGRSVDGYITSAASPVFTYSVGRSHTSVMGAVVGGTARVPYTSAFKSVISPVSSHFVKVDYSSTITTVASLSSIQSTEKIQIVFENAVCAAVVVPNAIISSFNLAFVDHISTASFVALPISDVDFYNLQIVGYESVITSVAIPTTSISFYNTQVYGYESIITSVAVPDSDFDSLNLQFGSLDSIITSVSQPKGIVSFVNLQTVYYTSNMQSVGMPKAIVNGIEIQTYGIVGVGAAIGYPINTNAYGLVTISQMGVVVEPASSYGIGKAQIILTVCQPASTFVYKRFTHNVGLELTPTDNGFTGWYIHSSSDLGVLYSVGAQVFRSTNGGISWTEILDFFPNYITFAKNGIDVFLYESGVFYLSLDSGDTFTDITQNIPDLSAWPGLYVEQVSISGNGESLYVGLTGYGLPGVLLVSNDGGENWDVAEFTQPPVSIWDIKVSYSGRCISFLNGDDESIQFSTDYGATWTRSVIPGAVWENGAFISDDGKTIWACMGFEGWLDGLALSTDGGTTWQTRTFYGITECDGYGNLSFADDGTVFVAGYADADWDIPVVMIFKGDLNPTLITDVPEMDVFEISGDAAEVVYIDGTALTVDFGKIIWEYPKGITVASPVAFKKKGTNPVDLGVFTSLAPFGSTNLVAGVLDYGLHFNNSIAGLTDVGVYYDQHLSAPSEILGSNNGRREVTSSIVDFGVINSGNITQPLEIGGGAATWNFACMLSVDGVQNRNIVSSIVELSNYEGTSFLSGSNALDNATNILAPYTIRILLDGEDITNLVDSCVIDSTESSVFDTVTISMPDGSKWSIDAIPNIVQVVFHDKVHEFKVEEFSGVGYSREIWGRPVTALLAEPWAVTGVWNEQNTNAVTAKELCEEILGASVIWQLDDWPLPPKYEVSGTPIEAIQDVADAGGGLLVANSYSGVVIIRKKWPIRLVDMSTPDIMLNREISIEDITAEKSDATKYNSVVVNGWSPDEVLPDFEVESDAVLGSDAYIRLYWRGSDHPSFANWITDGSAEFLETRTEEVTEVVTFDDGVANTKYPIWNFVSFEWFGVDYGDIVWLENGYSNSLETINSQYGVAKVTYITTFERWKLSNQAVEVVQFGIEVSQGTISAEVELTADGVAAGEVTQPLLGSTAACVQYGVSYLDDSRITRTVKTTVPRMNHIDIGVVAKVDDEITGISVFGKVKSVSTSIEAGKITQSVEVLS